MKATSVDNTKFQGKLFIQNKLSRVADSNIKKVKTGIEELIAPKKYDLYIEQNYNYNNITFIAGSRYITAKEVLPLLSSSSKYLEAAKNVVNKYEKALQDQERKELLREKKRQNLRDLIDLAEIILLLPLVAISDLLREISPKWAKKFEKFIEKII